MELSSLLLVLLLISDIHSEETEESQAETENASESQSSHMDDADKKASDIKPTLTVEPQSSVFTGDSVNLTCEVDQSTGWEFLFLTPSNHESIAASGTKTISSVPVFDGGEYKCRARRGEIPENYTQYSEPVTVKVEKRPKAEVVAQPDEHVFRGETVTLTCVINGGGVTSWQYRWNKDSVIEQNKQQNYTISPVSQSDAGKYTCRGTETGGSRSSDTSDAVTLTVSDQPKPSLTVQPQSSVFTGDSVTLTCDVNQSTGWKFVFYTPSQHRNYEASGTKTITVSTGGQYWCRARRRNYESHDSDPITVTVENQNSVVTETTALVADSDCTCETEKLEGYGQ